MTPRGQSSKRSTRAVISEIHSVSAWGAAVAVGRVEVYVRSYIRGMLCWAFAFSGCSLLATMFIERDGLRLGLVLAFHVALSVVLIAASLEVDLLNEARGAQHNGRT
jgi:hypothetical protein